MARARALQARGRRFESVNAHQKDGITLHYSQVGVIPHDAPMPGAIESDDMGHVPRFPSASRPESPVQGVALGSLALAFLVLFTSLGVFSLVALAGLTAGLDAPQEPGVSRPLLLRLLGACSGLVSGLGASLIVKVRGWRLVLPTLVAALVGWVVSALIAAFAAGGVFGDQPVQPPPIRIG